jgi:eukaryotic-like serine/threonine-protein kinase
MSAPERLTAALADRYRIERPLGQGGMATVYLAEDLKHQRKVAIKVLKPDLAAVLGAERFVTEIKTTAALQHPHILPLFDSGEADSFLFYVMPFIDGETLRTRLDRETQLDVDEALRITRDVADALDYAHRQGVIHRDIKPENILLHDGRPMVADFGIALAVSAAAGGRMTETGLSLGTPHYMSPEQATAEKEITARSDVYSLASVCYEMLAGQPPHLGGSAQQIIMKIIAEAPQPVTALRRAVPANVAAALSKALEKLPADRFSSARAFADALADPHFATRSGGRLATAAGGASSRTTRLLAGALTLSLAAVAALLLRPAPSVTPSAYALALPEHAAPIADGFAAFTPDGERMIYLGPSQGGRADQKLWMKRRGETEPVSIPETDAAWAMDISPDGKQLAYVTGDLLRRMPVEGRVSTLVATGIANVPRSVAWENDTTLLFVGRAGRSVMRVGQSGGEPTEVWTSDSLQLFGISALPRGQGILVLACPPPCDLSRLIVLDASGKDAFALVDEEIRYAQYLDGGALLTANRDFFVGVRPFDLKTRRATGPEVIVFDSVYGYGSTSYVSVSRQGTLVTRRGVNVQNVELELALYDRQGREQRPDSSFSFRITRFAGNYGWSLSPDATRLAIGLYTNSGDDIWLKSLPRGPATRLSFDVQAEYRPRWTPDGRAVTYVTDDGIRLRQADGSGKDSLLLAGRFNEGMISPDGKWLVVRSGALGAISGGRDVFGMRLGVDTALVPLLDSPFDESAFSISPDGKWIAYESDETGRTEIFVRPFPDTKRGKVQVSIEGARAPAWSRDSRELYFSRSNGDVMFGARVLPGADFRVATPESLFVHPQAMANLLRSWYTPFDVTPDGRFVLVRQAVRSERFSSSPLIVVEHWWDPVRGEVRR